MIVTRHTINACCGRTSIIFKLDRPISSDLLNFLVNKGFVEDPKFTKAGMVYVDNPSFIVTGAFGSDKLQAKCKLKECDQKLNELEGLFLQME